MANRVACVRSDFCWKIVVPSIHCASRLCDDNHHIAKLPPEALGMPEYVVLSN